MGVLKEVSLRTRFERRQATRKRLIDAALALLTIKGFQQTTLDDISQKAGLTKGAIYFHFSNKQDLLVEVVRHLGDLKLLWPPFPEFSQELGLSANEIESIVFEILVEAKHQPKIRNLLWTYNSKTEADLILDLGHLIQHQVLAVRS